MPLIREAGLGGGEELVGAPVRRRLAHVVFCGGLLFGVVVACCSCVMITGVYLFDWSGLVVRDI